MLRVRNDRAFDSEDAAYGKSVADVGIGHESALHGNGEETGAFHLHDGIVFKIAAPLFVGNRFGARRRRRFLESASEFAAELVFDEIFRRGQNAFQFFFEAIFLSGEDEFGNERDGMAHRFAKRDAKFNEIF